MRMIQTGVAVALIAALAVGAWLFFAGNSAPGPAGGPGARPPQPVYVAAAREETFGDRLEAIGTLSANESITVTARVQGIIRSLNFADGQVVRAGEEIAAIDAGQQDAQLRVELANLEQQKKELERTENLAKDQHVSASRVDEQMASLKKAEANVSAARARVGDFRIVAPFPGVLGTRKVSLGALVSPGTVVTTLDDISVVKLDFAIPENFLAVLKPGLDLEATSSAYPKEIFKGQVVSVDSRIDPTTRSVNIRAVIPNKNEMLRPGMLMVVELIKDQRQSLMIPEQALMPEGTKQYVFVAGADGVAVKTPIVIGRRRPGFVEVIEGLKAGDRVVTEGQMDLRAGAKVEILTPNGNGGARPAGAPSATERTPG